MNKIIVTLIMLISLPLFGEVKVLAFSGSLREASYNKNLAREVVKMSNDAGGSAVFVDLRDLPMPFLDEDIPVPENAKILKAMIEQSDIIVITSPNYNNSFSGVLKNTLDWVSVDGGRKLFQGKKVILMCASPGKNGLQGLGHLKDVITKMGGEVLPYDFGVPSAHIAFDKAGNLQDLDLRTKLNDMINQVVAK